MPYAIHDDDKRTEQPPAPMREGERHLATAEAKLRKIREQLRKPIHRVTDPQ